MTRCLAFVVWVCVWVPVRESLCLFWCETYTKGLRSRSPARPEVDEGRKVPEKTERVSWQRRQSGDESREEKREEQKSKRRLLGHVDLQMLGGPTREVKLALLVALWEFSLEYTLTLAHGNTECTKSVTSTSSPLVLGADPSPYLFVCSFLPPPRLCDIIGNV